MLGSGYLLTAATAVRRTCCISKRTGSEAISSFRIMRSGKPGLIKKISGSITT